MSNPIGTLENKSIYIILTLRGALPGFHKSILFPTEVPTGEVWHATNPSGGWFLETETMVRLMKSLSVCVALKVGTVTDQSLMILRTTLEGVPFSGEPSVNTGEAFSCTVWVKDALLALHKAGVITLIKDIDTINQEAIAAGEADRSNTELGTGPPIVLNNTGFSITS
jgi:hypothetical protein